MSEKNRYSDDELVEFKELIRKKLSSAKDELLNLQTSLKSSSENGTSDTSGETMSIEDGSASAEKEQISQLAQRQQKFIANLEAALARIENKTYGICKVTGKLISKERLRAVPITTQSIEAKLRQDHP
ncbi:MAG: DnaK suppressor protein [Sphingobacteriales bacterium]|jgi:DnaK suppressor protein